LRQPDIKNTVKEEIEKIFILMKWMNFFIISCVVRTVPGFA